MAQPRDVPCLPWKEELLDGLLGNDLLGFHLRYHCANFLETIDRGLEAMVDTEHGDVWRGGELTRVRPFPISIDFEQHEQEGRRGRSWRATSTMAKGVGDRSQFLGIGIDRADYTKGIPDRLWAVDRLLETYPEYRGKLLFLQVAVPSRTHIAEYQRLTQELENTVREINSRWAQGTWCPIRLCARHLPPNGIDGSAPARDFLHGYFTSRRNEPGRKGIRGEPG